MTKEFMMATVTGPVEAVDASKLSERREDFYEVIGNQTVEKPAMGALESTLASLLLEIMAPYARSSKLGQAFAEVLFDLRPTVDRSRRPDLSFVSARKWPLNRRGPGTETWPIVPDLVVEIISPTNSANSVLEKVREYLTAGVQLVWVVYPIDREVHVFDARNTSIVSRVQRGGVLKGEPVLPGFELPLESLFGETDETPQA
jgi:Uma2 family endonuclease